MRIIFTCGGTGGHINPALAVANLFRDKKPDADILFVGAPDGMEAKLVPAAGFRIRTVQISSFLRSASPKAIAHNIKSAFLLGRGRRQADKILDDFRPDVVVGTGGYASYPVLSRAAARGIPTAIHESNAFPGLTTRSLADKADLIMVGVEESVSRYKEPSKVSFVGTPVREEFLFTDKERARELLGISDSRPLVVSCWGSLGAREMNKKIAEFIRLETEHDDFHHIHATGSFGWRWMPQLIADMGVDITQHPSIDMREYIHDMPIVMNAADVVICRAGASTLAEVRAAAAPAIIVPSPNVAENHQEKNALALAATGGAVMLRESECTGESLYRMTLTLLSDDARRREMSAALSSSAVLDSAERIYREVCRLTGR